MIDALIQMILGWTTVWQFFFVLFSAGFMTQVTCVAIRGFTRDFMHTLAVLLRGWPTGMNIDDISDELDDVK